MNKMKEARLNMYDAVIAYCNNNPALVASIPAFQSAFTDFQNAVSGIHTTARLQADVITGIAADKMQMRISLCQQAVGLCDVIFALASATGNNELKGKADFSVSDLKRLKGESLVSVCTNIFEAANANVAGLATYGITAANITDFQNVTGAYAAKITSPRNAVSQRSSYARMLNNFFVQANSILKTQLDKTVGQFKITDGNFYNTYQNNRIIIDPGTSATQIAGTVTNTVNNQPVAGATVQLVGNGISNITDAEGNYILKSVAIGTQSIRITKAGFSDDVIDNISVKLGKTVSVDAAINPVAA